MSTLVWDDVGTRFYEAGVDRGVLYLPDGTGVPWSGLISVNETVSGNESSPVYFDGVKYADVLVSGEFAATMSAFTYPDEFQQFEGIVEIGNGLSIANQQQARFGLSYRTRIGNDVDQEVGYKIHVVYNLLAVPSEKNYQTMTGDSSALSFAWTLSSIPSETPGFRPTSHLIFDSRKMGPLLLADIETKLYGNEVNTASLPPLSSFVTYIGAWVIIRITDNFDGTWTATGPDEYFTMLDATTFEIIQANAIYVDDDTYIVSDTTY